MQPDLGGRIFGRRNARLRAHQGNPLAVEAVRRLQVLLRMLPYGTATLLKRKLSISLGDLDIAEEIIRQRGGSIGEAAEDDLISEELAANADEIVRGGAD